MSKAAITLLAILLQLVIAFLPFIPGISSVLPPSPTPRQHLDGTILCIGLSVAVLSAYLAAIFVIQNAEAESLRKEIRELFPTRIEEIRDDAFYSDFLAAARQAESHVYISYLALYPPADRGGDERRRYYREIHDVMRHRQRVRFRRLVRRSPATEEWITGLLTSLEGVANADIAALDEPRANEMPLALSVQVVDSSKVWLVAIESHERVGEFRDVYVENEVFATAMSKYFNRLWQRSDVLLDSGRVTEHGEAVRQRGLAGGRGGRE